MRKGVRYNQNFKNYFVICRKVCFFKIKDLIRLSSLFDMKIKVYLIFINSSAVGVRYCLRCRYVRCFKKILGATKKVRLKIFLKTGILLEIRFAKFKSARNSAYLFRMAHDLII